MIGFYILIGIISLFSWLVSNTLKRKFEKYSKVHLRNGMSGAEIAQKMLDDHGISDVKVISTPGRLTDHYNPQNKTVNLSEAVYNQRNAASAAAIAWMLSLLLSEGTLPIQLSFAGFVTSITLPELADCHFPATYANSFNRRGSCN